MITDDDKLALDLAAWQPPPAPPLDIDRVIDRARAPEIVAAMPSRRAWWFAAGGVLAGAVAVIAIVLARGGDPVVADHGTTIATTPQHLQLGGIGVDLAANAQLHWRRTPGGLVVDALRGVTTWTIPDGDRVTIEATGVGSIEAVDRTHLRLEAAMNATDVKVVGTSAAVAAAVAMVTVIVYEGHVRATSGAQTITIAPGPAVTLPLPPPPPDPVVGGTVAPNPVDARGRDKLRYEALELAAMHRCKDYDALIAGIVDEESRKYVTASVTCTIPQSDEDRRAVLLGRAKGLAKVHACDKLAQLVASASPTDRPLIAAVKCTEAPKEATAPTVGPEPTCQDPKNVDPSSSVPICDEVAEVFRKSGEPICDFDGKWTKAKESYATGQFATSLAHSEAALACREHENARGLAIFAACMSGNGAKAKALFPKLTTERMRTNAIVKCASMKITLQ